MQQKIFACFLMLVMSVVSAEVCSSTHSTTDEFKVYFGWPFSFYCPDAFSNIDYDYDDEVFSEFSSITCVITDVATGSVLMNSTFVGSISEFEFYGDEELIYRIDDVNENTPTEYEIYLQKASYCLTYRFSLITLEFPEETCEEHMKRSGALPLEITVGNPFEAKCDVRVGDKDTPAKLVHNFESDGGPNGTKAYWLFNCLDRLPNNTAMRRAATQNLDPTSLYFEDTTYKDNPGIYTCVVEHNGMKRYRVHHKICVKPQVSSQLSIKCTNKTVRPGDDVELDCFVDAGLGESSRILFTGWFNKLNSTGQIDVKQDDVACVAYVDENLNATDERISCELYQNKIEARRCFFDLPTEEELNAQRTSVKMVYRIRNVKQSDFGNYRARIDRASRPVDAAFTLSYDIVPRLTKSHMLLIMCLSTIGGVSLICLLLWLACAIEIRWIWFRLFAPKEKEIKKYSAYLAYYYSKDMPVTSPSLLESFVMSLNTRIREIAGDTFDRCRDPGSEQYTAECISAKLSECHRVVIILTPEYINDHWGVYEAYEAWKVVIENRTKIIFVMLPETTEAIDNLPDELKTTLNKALQRHKIMKWNGSLPFTRRMRIQLEMLMPKLPKKYRMEIRCKDHEQNSRISPALNGYHSGVHSKDKNANIRDGNAV